VTDWCWFALVETGTRIEAPLATATATTTDGAPAGTFAAWPAGRKPHRDALRTDARLVDPRGQPAWVSLVTVPRDAAPLFDDVAVSEAMRQVLRGIPPAAVSTLVRDATTFAGAVTIRRTWPEALRDDPFARLHPNRILHAGAGLFADLPVPAGPAIQRYSGKPWPAAGFDN
jgi:hypothetical protein